MQVDVGTIYKISIGDGANDSVAPLTLTATVWALTNNQGYARMWGLSTSTVSARVITAGLRQGSIIFITDVYLMFYKLVLPTYSWCIGIKR